MNLAFDAAEVSRFCRGHGIARLDAFGSVLRPDFRADSDVDLLATLNPEADAQVGLLEWVAMAEGLQRIFGRPVDLLSRPAVEQSSNPYRKAAILGQTETLYAER